MKTIIFTAAAAKQFYALPLAIREQIETDLDAYAMTGKGDVKRLQGREGYRLRSGDYRVIFNEDRTTVLAVYVGRRRTTTYN